MRSNKNKTSLITFQNLQPIVQTKLYKQHLTKLTGIIIIFAIAIRLFLLIDAKTVEADHNEVQYYTFFWYHNVQSNIDSTGECGNEIVRY